MALGEFEFIAERLRPLAAATPGALDLEDDAALVDPPAGSALVVTKDAMVAGVHFLAEDPPGDVARKLLRVNLSDLAAMGAAPLGYLLALIRAKETSRGVARRASARAWPWIRRPSASACSAATPSRRPARSPSR